jgi:hypothetical protein
MSVKTEKIKIILESLNKQLKNIKEINEILIIKKESDKLTKNEAKSKKFRE